MTAIVLVDSKPSTLPPGLDRKAMLHRHPVNLEALHTTCCLGLVDPVYNRVAKVLGINRRISHQIKVVET